MRPVLPAKLASFDRPCRALPALPPHLTWFRVNAFHDHRGDIGLRPLTTLEEFCLRHKIKIPSSPTVSYGGIGHGLPVTETPLSRTFQSPSLLAAWIRKQGAIIPTSILNLSTH